MVGPGPCGSVVMFGGRVIVLPARNKTIRSRLGQASAHASLLRGRASG